MGNSKGEALPKGKLENILQKKVQRVHRSLSPLERFTLSPPLRPPGDYTTQAEATPMCGHVWLYYVQLLPSQAPCRMRLKLTCCGDYLSPSFVHKSEPH